MKNFVAACVVLCGMAGSAWGETKEAAKQPAAGPKNVTAGQKKAAAGPEKITVDLGGGVKMEMTLIPAGEFLMGSGESAEASAAFFNKTYGMSFLRADLFKHEHPQHGVRITRPFYFGTYHVTRGQFRQFVAATAYKTDAEKGEWLACARLESRQKQFRVQREILLAERRLRAERRAPRGQCELE